jgi:hypothetical protein
MTNLTREVLVKLIVAEEIRDMKGDSYIEALKHLYHKWEHVSSDELCTRYNDIQKTNITKEQLKP